MPAQVEGASRADAPIENDADCPGPPRWPAATSILVAALTEGVLAEAARAWGRGYWGLFGRLHYSLVALSALTFVVLLGYYNPHAFGA